MRNPDASYSKRKATQKQGFKGESNTGSLLTFPRKPAANDALMTQRAAIRAGLNQRLLYRLSESGRIHAVIVGRRTLYLESDVRNEIKALVKSCYVVGFAA
jgi:hypothetical protein